ncbi:MAG: hypothetical protein ABR587_04640 [Candidatus Binatia bacterium]
MTMFTRPELEQLRSSMSANRDAVARQSDLIERLVAQAEYALDCAALLEEAVHYPADPYSDAEVLVARLTDGFNEIWNRHHYASPGGPRRDLR